MLKRGDEENKKIRKAQSLMVCLKHRRIPKKARKGNSYGVHHGRTHQDMAGTHQSQSEQLTYFHEEA